jgi:hypothetical protein
MTRDDIIRMAQEAHLVMYDYDHPSLERFAALVAAAEREACAKVCDELQDVPATEPRHCAQDIRLRGQA